MGCCESCFKQDGGAPLNKFAKPLLEADHLRMTVGGEKYPLLGSEEIMRPKLNGTCTKPTQQNLRYGVDSEKANHICCFNRNFAEDPGFFLLAEWHTTVNRKEATTYYDSVTGKPLFTAPKGRTFSTFMAESNALGWLSFRDHEVVWARAPGDWFWSAWSSHGVQPRGFTNAAGRHRKRVKKSLVERYNKSQRGLEEYRESQRGVQSHSEELRDPYAMWAAD